MLRSFSSHILKSSRHWIVVPPGEQVKFNNHSNRVVVISLTSRRFTDGLKGKVTNFFERGTKTASDALKKQTDDALDKIQLQAKKASQQLKVEAQKVYEKSSSHATDAMQRSTFLAAEAIQKGKSSAEDILRSSSKKVSQQIQSAASQTGEAISHKSKAAVEATSERIRNSSVGVLANAQQFGQKALRWFFWWSLAAIAVYGLATSIPSALLRYSLSSGDSKDDQKSSTQPLLANTRTSSVDDAANSKGWMYSMLYRTQTEVKPNETPDTPNKGLWSALWGNGSAKD